jgi:hypothetical protein
MNGALYQENRENPSHAGKISPGVAKARVLLRETKDVVTTKDKNLTIFDKAIYHKMKS